MIGAIFSSGTGALTIEKPDGSVEVATKSTSASESSPRALAMVSGSSLALRIASCAFRTAAASAGWSAAWASCERRSRSRVTSSTGTSSRTEVNASICACSIRRGSTGAAPLAGFGAALRPMTGASVPASAS